MYSLSSSTALVVRENPSSYSPFSRKNVVYEVALGVDPSSSWLKDLSHAHRLVQTLLQGELLGDYELLDFLIWPEGLLTRVSLKKTPSLSEFLRSLKEKSAPAQEDYRRLWREEPQWIRLVPPEKLEESTRLFLETAQSVQLGLSDSTPGLFFFYRNPRRGR